MAGGDITRSGTVRSLPWKQLFAEFIAITAGVFLGLLADDYRDFRSDRETEQEYLRLVAADLERDYEQLIKLRNYISNKSDGAQLINSEIANPEFMIDPLEQAITEIIFTVFYDPQRTAYLGLRDSAQVQIIESAMLRSAVMSYFEVTQPDLVARIEEFNDYQHRVRLRIGKHIRLFSPDRFDSLRPNSTGPNISKLISPVSDIRADVELMNDIVEVGARGFQIVDLISQAESQNKEILANLNEFLE